MEDFDYGFRDVRNRPPPIQAKHLQNDRMSATAAQKLCFFKLFPIIFHDIIDQIPAYIVYKILREILDLVLSYPFRKEWLASLSELCDRFQQVMIIHFPDKMTPKVHYVCEYDRLVYDYGPPIKQWCFRYEACHAYFKRVAMRARNFKNVPKMLVTRFWLKQCFKFSNLHTSVSLHPIGIKKMHNKCFTTSMRDALLKHFERIDFNTDFIQCNSLIYENITYNRSGVYVLALKPVHEQPIFVQVVFILKRNEKWWLLVNNLCTILYEEELCAWEIKSIQNYSILDPCELIYIYKGLDVYHVKGSSFVSFTSRLTSYER